MQRRKLGRLLSDLNKKIDVAKKQYKETKEASAQTAKTARASWSSGGDREYAKGQEEINAKRLSEYKELRNELKSAVSKDPPKKVLVPSVVTITLDDGQSEEFYIVGTPVSLEGYRLVSQDSPLGKYLVGMRVAEKIDFNKGALKGEIVEIG